MTSSNNLKKLVSIGAALLLAVGGSLVAAQPASAAESSISNLVVLHTGQTTAQFQADLTPCTGCHFDQNIPTAGGDFIAWIARPSGTATLTSSDATDVVTHSSPVTGEVNGSSLATTGSPTTTMTGKLINLTGLTAGTTYRIYLVLTSTQSDNTTKSYSTVAALPYTTDAGSGGGGGSSACSPPVTVTALSWSASSIGTTGSVRQIYNNDPTIGTSIVCYASVVDLSILSTLNGVIIGTPSHYSSYGMGISSNTLTLAAILAGPIFSGLTVHDGDVYATNYYVSLGRVPTLADTPSFTRSIILNTGVSSSPTVSSQVPESAKPLPTWAAPILKQIPSLSKTLTTDGGKLSLTDGDFSSLQSVTVGGKAVAYSIDAKGDVSIPVPAGQGGTTADLLVVFSGGKMLIQDGIKYVTPTDVAKVPEAPVAGFKANSSQVSGALAASILYAAQVDHKANAIACTGYAASQAQVALATARAEAACGYATGAYANLAKSTVSVVVNKAKAKSAAVGIKVYH